MFKTDLRPAVNIDAILTRSLGVLPLLALFEILTFLFLVIGVEELLLFGGFFATLYIATLIIGIWRMASYTRKVMKAFWELQTSSNPNYNAEEPPWTQFRKAFNPFSGTYLDWNVPTNTKDKRHKALDQLLIGVFIFGLSFFIVSQIQDIQTLQTQISYDDRIAVIAAIISLFLSPIIAILIVLGVFTALDLSDMLILVAGIYLPMLYLGPSMRNLMDISESYHSEVIEQRFGEKSRLSWVFAVSVLYLSVNLPGFLFLGAIMLSLLTG